ncbi:LOW QUALITY PROTEIN: KLHDC4 isoform 25, partial [Pongo abelii]
LPGKVLPEKCALMWPHLGTRAPQRPMRESRGFPGWGCRMGQAPPCRARPPAPAPSHPSSSLSLTPGPGSPRQIGPPCRTVAALHGLGAWQSCCGGGVGCHGWGRQPLGRWWSRLNPYPVESPGLFHTRSPRKLWDPKAVLTSGVTSSHGRLGSPGTRPGVSLCKELPGCWAELCCRPRKMTKKDRAEAHPPLLGEPRGAHAQQSPIRHSLGSKRFPRCGWQLVTSSGGAAGGLCPMGHRRGKEGGRVCTLGRTGGRHRPEQVA